MKPVVLYALGCIFAAIAVLMTWQTLKSDPIANDVLSLGGFVLANQIIYAMTALAACIVTAIFWGCGSIVEALQRRDALNSPSAPH